MNHKKHLTNWFTTSNMRAINLLLVTDISVHKLDGAISGATIYTAVNDSRGQASISVNAKDAARIFALLF